MAKFISSFESFQELQQQRLFVLGW